MNCCLLNLVLSFNTQPPEGGWFLASKTKWSWNSFNTQPPEGGWLYRELRRVHVDAVSTHSRLKAAGAALLFGCFHRGSFNTQPPEGGWGNIN